MEPLISVIIPMHNMEDYLCQCVNSVLEQTYTNLEIILVDDGSTDASGMICDQYAENDSRVVVIHKENGGISSARNAGLERASGAYICFVDSDDYIADNLCDTAMNVFQRESVDIVEYGTVLTNEKGQPIGNIENQLGCFSDKTELLTMLLRNQLQNYIWNKVFARHVFEGISFPVGYSWEDMGTTYKLLLQAKALCSIPDELYFYRQRETSIIHNITAKALRDIFTMQKCRYEDLLKVCPDVAELAVPLVTQAALQLYDCSLWAQVDPIVKEAEVFLSEQEAAVSALTKSAALKLYYRNRDFYNCLRIMRHRIGTIVKLVVNIMK